MTSHAAAEGHDITSLTRRFESAFLRAWDTFLASGVGTRIPEVFQSEWTKWTVGLRGTRWSASDVDLPLFVSVLALFDDCPSEGSAEAAKSRWDRIRREENYIDLLLANSRPPLVANHWGYPASYDVLLEHEFSGTDLETEMWKLLFFRGRLKVIVAYDDFGDPRSDQVWKAGWVPEKISQLRDMWRAVASSRDGEEYVLLVGRRKSVDGGFASWRAVNLSVPKGVDVGCEGWQVWVDASRGA